MLIKIARKNKIFMVAFSVYATPVGMGIGNAQF
jgi:hypothetical protein